MKRVLYLHGLESKQGGEKVEFLANECIVHAPEMDYTRKDVFSFLTKKIEDFQPDFIIGSSMGGYAAYILGALYKIPVLAFNPALHSRKFNPAFPAFVNLHTPSKITVVIGAQDTVIKPNKTLDYMEDHFANRGVQSEIERINTMGHRVPFAVFRDMYNKHIK
tara:strand:+ start:5107 stop:5595 length:489 start_codon:yes stop_codon:yes gene_type:complete